MDETDFAYHVTNHTTLFTEDGKRIEVFNITVTSTLTSNQSNVRLRFTTGGRKKYRNCPGVETEVPFDTATPRYLYWPRTPTGAYSPVSTIVDGDINRVLPRNVNAVTLADEDNDILEGIIGGALIELCKIHLREQSHRFNNYPQALGLL